MTKIVTIEGIDELGRLKRGANFNKQAPRRPVRRTPPPPPPPPPPPVSEEEQEVIEALGCSKEVRRILPAQKEFTLANNDPALLTEGKLDLLVARDKMLTERNIIRSIQGIGSVRAEKYNNSIDVIDDALHAIDTEPDPVAYMGLIEEDILNGVYQNETEMAGIGNVDEIGKARAKKAQTRRANRSNRKPNPNRQMKTRTGKFLKKAAQKAKKGTKALKKVATAPQRAAIKLVLERLLPGAAIFFLYLFINDPAIIARLPKKVKRKREVALRVKNFIVNIAGMTDSQFMGIVRNGIMKKVKVSPETILSKHLQGITGIGFVELALKAIPIIIDIIGRLAKVFKKKGDVKVAKGDVPNPEQDFNELSEQEKTNLSSQIKKQTDLPEPAEQAQNSSSSSDNASSNQSDNQSTSNSNSDSGNDTDDVSRVRSSSSKKDTDASGEIQKQDDNSDTQSTSGEFATGGRKPWNSLGK